MGLDSDEIRRKITNILIKNGLTKGKVLADQVIESGLGSQKTVYHEIKTMCDDGLLKRNELNRAKVEYELREISDAIKKQLEFYEDTLNEINDALNEFHLKMERKKGEIYYLERLMTIVTRMKQLQKVEATFRIFEMFPLISKSKHFVEQKKRIEELWRIIRGLIAHQHEEKFLYEVFTNFRPIRIGKTISKTL